MNDSLSVQSKQGIYWGHQGLASSAHVSVSSQEEECLCRFSDPWHQRTIRYPLKRSKRPDDRDEGRAKHKSWQEQFRRPIGDHNKWTILHPTSDGHSFLLKVLHGCQSGCRHQISSIVKKKMRIRWGTIRHRHYAFHPSFTRMQQFSFLYLGVGNIFHFETWRGNRSGSAPANISCSYATASPK